MNDQSERMRAIKEEVLNLTGSPLYEERIRTMAYPVIGEGSHEARVMFVGEAPGRNEAETGRPFCGASGRVLDQLLQGIGLDRKAVYVTNVVKDRPPENRDPTAEEIALYGPFLDRQIDIIQPAVIATLGRFSMAYLLRRFDLEAHLATISKIHGRPHEARVPYGTVTIIPLYHPAVAVYDRTRFDELLNDFKKLLSYV
ncbi:MAG: uracil-DNA glycosylase [Patescibacteria group bacterium]